MTSSAEHHTNNNDGIHSGSATSSSSPSFLMEAPMLRTVFFHWLRLGFILNPIGSFITRIRWMLAPPLQSRILPQCLLAGLYNLQQKHSRNNNNNNNKDSFNPASLCIDYFVAPSIHMMDWTVGELVLMTPLITWSLLCLHYSIGDDIIKSVGQSGMMTLYGMLYTFLTANKSNSIFAILFGLPVDRLVPLHRLSSIVTLGMACFHTSVAYELYSGKLVEVEVDVDVDVGVLAEDGTIQDTVVDVARTEIIEEEESLMEFLVGRGDRLNTSGSVVVAAMVVLLLTSYFKSVLRTRAFQTWYAMHIVLAMSILFGLWAHIGNAKMLAFVGVWWGLDLVFRYGLPRYRGNVCGQAGLRLIGVGANSNNNANNDNNNDNNPSAATSTETPTPARQSHEPAVEISISPKPFDYMPGQFVKICIPAISMYEYHSVSISSAPQEDNALTVHFRALGDWTNKVVELAKSTPSTKVWLEGPYGALSFDLGSQGGQEHVQSKSPDASTNESTGGNGVAYNVLPLPRRVISSSTTSPASVSTPQHGVMEALQRRPKIFVLVSGGIGVTPCQSLGKYLMYQQLNKYKNDNSNNGNTDDGQFKLIKFIWAVRSMSMVEDIPPLALQDGSYRDAADDAETGNGAVSASILSRSSDTQDVELQMDMDDGPSKAEMMMAQNAKVEIDIYCTRMKKQPQADDIISVGAATTSNAGIDAVSVSCGAFDTTTNVHAGRPNLDEILEQVKKEAIEKYGGETSIAVLGCGPSALMQNLEVSSRKHGTPIVGECGGAFKDEDGNSSSCNDDVFIDCHIESFDL